MKESLFDRSNGRNRDKCCLFMVAGLFYFPSGVKFSKLMANAVFIMKVRKLLQNLELHYLAVLRTYKP